MHGGQYSACAPALSVAPRLICPYFYAHKTITKTPPKMKLILIDAYAL